MFHSYTSLLVRNARSICWIRYFGNACLNPKLDVYVERDAPFRFLELFFREVFVMARLFASFIVLFSSIVFSAVVSGSITSPSNRHIKRAVSRAVNSCPPDKTFRSSQCISHLSPQAYSVECTLQGPVFAVDSYYPGSCSPDEFCVYGWDWMRVQTLSTEHWSKEAFCITQEDFVHYSTEQLRKIGQMKAGTFSMDFGKMSHNDNMLLLGVLQEDFNANVGATRIDVQAQRVVNIRGRWVYQDLPGGEAFVNTCSNLTMLPIPRWTQNVNLDVVMADAVQKAILWVGSMEM